MITTAERVRRKAFYNLTAFCSTQQIIVTYFFIKIKCFFKINTVFANIFINITVGY